MKLRTTFNRSSGWNSIKNSVCLLVGIWCVFCAQIAQGEPAPQDWEYWLTDFSRHSVPLAEIVSGGPPKDGIPSISNPKFVTVGEIETIGPREPVITLNIGEDARAYPISVLMWHEIVNDVVDGKPVTVTYCPLCNSAIVFEAELDGRRMMFGTTGRLRNSDMLMYDRRTETWWQQFTGEAIIGKLMGAKLKPIASRMESFESFTKRFPDGKILVPREAGLRRYGENPYIGYDSLDKPFLYNGKMPEGIKPMTYVVLVRRADQAPYIVTLEHLRNQKSIVTDNLTLEWQEGLSSALDTAQIGNGREVGNVIVTDSKSGVDLGYDLTFAFVAHAFYPEAPILTSQEKDGHAKNTKPEKGTSDPEEDVEKSATPQGSLEETSTEDTLPETTNDETKKMAKQSNKITEANEKADTVTSPELIVPVPSPRKPNKKQ